MAPPTDAQMKRIVGALNERGQFRSLISLASTPSRGAYERVLHDLYRLLRLDTRAAQEYAEGFYSIRRSKESAQLNRYREIYAFDRTAVRIPNDVDTWLRTGGDVEELGEDESGYLNANVIDDGKGSWWVACQAPLPATIHPFLMAILTRSATFKHVHLYGGGKHHAKVSPPKTAIIVQLTGLYEGDVVKAHPYLPTRPGESLIYDPPAHIANKQPHIKLTLDRTTPLEHTSSVQSTLTLTGEGAAIPRMTLHHFAFAGWPDFGVPRGDDVYKLQELIREVGRTQRDAQKQDGGTGCEVWVHWCVSPLFSSTLFTHAR
ncbi:hypothetical protein QFC19_003051 [Naganishia cerealis]|uniref:Uncharacterized protein n=1 Tax=Naganishia cerealis TaxID=610337 RepID=A0ACC2W6A8_9TREE|nr:hypothetical protein QFC19_003051 [Naganishia cerealis]